MVEKEVAEWAEERKAEISELKAREIFRREFIGNVSHELKTPIFNIQGYILTLIDGGLEDDKINMKYLKRASKSVDRMINLIQDMDTLNKLESGILEIKVSDFDFARLIHDVLDMLEDSAKKRSINLKTTLKRTDEQIVHADPNRIEQVLFNLLINAIKYGKRDGHVNIKTFDMEDRILVEVEDDGMGIPEQDLSRIFERFYRVDKSRTRDAVGSCLGLSIVKHIIDAHKETINVRSTEGVGSTFSFTLKKKE
jgi:two-component system phosphate regulon sensor histidine kinase PhoR